MCQCCSQLYSHADCAQVMAAADQVDEQLHACSLAFKTRLQEESRWWDVTFYGSFDLVMWHFQYLFCGSSMNRQVVC